MALVFLTSAGGFCAESKPLKDYLSQQETSLKTKMEEISEKLFKIQNAYATPFSNLHVVFEDAYEKPLKKIQQEIQNLKAQCLSNAKMLVSNEHLNAELEKLEIKEKDWIKTEKEYKQKYSEAYDTLDKEQKLKEEPLKKERATFLTQMESEIKDFLKNNVQEIRDDEKYDTALKVLNEISGKKIAFKLCTQDFYKLEIENMDFLDNLLE